MKKHKIVRFYEINCFVYANYFHNDSKSSTADNFAIITFDIAYYAYNVLWYKYLDLHHEKNMHMKNFSSAMGAF
jgi:hypothetical protein